MKTSIYIIIVVFLISYLTTNKTFANTSETNITNIVNSSSNTSSSSNCHTTIRRIINGQEQDIDSNTCGDIHTGDANNRIDISNDAGSSSVTITLSPLPTIPPLPTTPPFPTISITPSDISPTITAEEQKIKEKLDKAKANLEEKQKQIKSQENILQKIETMLKDFFSNFHF